MSSGDSGSKNQVVTQNNAPWAPQVAPLKQSFTDATKLYNSGGLNLKYYPGQTRANLSPETLTSQNMISDRAQAGSPTLGAANNYVQGILTGNDTGLLNPALDRIRTNVNANYSSAGRYGSGYHDKAVADSVGNQIFSRMDQAAQFAPQLAQADYLDPQMLAGVGAQREQFAQNNINDAIARFNFQQSSPANAIALYQSLIGGGYGGTSQSTQPVQNSGANPWMQGAGLAAQLGGSLLGSYLGG